MKRTEARRMAEAKLDKLRAEIELRTKRIPQKDGTVRIKLERKMSIAISRGVLQVMPELQNDNGEVEVFGLRGTVLEDNGIEMQLIVEIK